MADLSSVKPGERTIEIRHPGEGHKIGLRVTLMSIDDERMKSIKRQMTDRQIYLNQRGKAFKAEDIEQNTVTLCFNAMTGWEWHIDESDGTEATFHGERPAFNKASVTAVLTEIDWIAQQITEDVSETKAFFGGSKPI